MIESKIYHQPNPAIAVLKSMDQHVIIEDRLGPVPDSAVNTILRNMVHVEGALAEPYRHTRGIDRQPYLRALLRHVFIDSVHGTYSFTFDVLHEKETPEEHINELVDELTILDSCLAGISTSTIIRKKLVQPESDHFSEHHRDFYKEWLRPFPLEHPPAT